MVMEYLRTSKCLQISSRISRGIVRSVGRFLEVISAMLAWDILASKAILCIAVGLVREILLVT